MDLTNHSGPQECLACVAEVGEPIVVAVWAGHAQLYILECTDPMLCKELKQTGTTVWWM